MNLKKYEAFVKTAEIGSISSAATAMGITQSGLTQLIGSLEKELGVTLLYRGRAGVRPTPDGEFLLPQIRDVIACDKKLSQAVKSLLAHRNMLRIATFKSVAVNWLPEIIREFSSVEPLIRIELVDGGYNNIETAFDGQHIDFAFAPLPCTPSFRSIPIFRDRLLAVLPPDHPAASDPSCPVSVFAKESVIGLSESIDLDARKVFDEAGIDPDIRYRVEDDYALLAMVGRGLGISIVPELILKGSSARIAVRELDPPAFRTIGIVFPADKPLRPEAKSLVDFVTSYVNREA